MLQVIDKYGNVKSYVTGSGGGGGGAQGTQGTQGKTGSQGSQGLTGSTSGFKYRFVVGTTPPISTSGDISYNNNTNISLVTKLYIATTSLIAGTTIYGFAETWDDSTNPGDKGYITIMNDSTLTWGQANIFKITGPVVPSISPAPPAGYSYYEVPVTYVGGSLSQPQGNSNITLTFTRTGDQGIQGVNGTQGVQGAALQGTQGDGAGLQYYFDTTTIPGFTSNGSLRYNNSVASSVTAIYIMNNTTSAVPVGSYIAAWGNSTSTDKGYITIRGNSNSSTDWNIFKITGTPVANTLYYTIPVTYVGGQTYVPTLNLPITVNFTQTGDKGIQGVQGLTGAGYTQSQGTQGVQGGNGPTGSTGLTGSQGTQGPSGSGTQGSQGAIGPTGIQGSQGAQGIQGSEGSQGSTGPTPTNAWLLGGNSGVKSGDYFGTTDYDEVRILVNGTEYGTINQQDGVIMLGATAPAIGGQTSIVAMGPGAGVSNTGNNVVFQGENAGNSNTSDNVIGIGNNAGNSNNAAYVVMFGDVTGNAIGNNFIINNNFLPSYADYAAALVALGGGVIGTTYLYHDQSTNSIGAVRL